MENKWSDYVQMRTLRTNGNQPPPLQVNEQKISAFFEEKNERVHKFNFFRNNIFQTHEKMYTMSQDSNIWKQIPLSKGFSQFKMDFLKIQTMVKIQHAKVSSKNDIFKDFSYEGCLTKNKFRIRWHNFLEFCCRNTKVLKEHLWALSVMIPSLYRMTHMLQYSWIRGIW